ncbi:MAG: DUF2807 domain-containing protein [Bacteroidia bacterium]
MKKIYTIAILLIVNCGFTQNHFEKSIEPFSEIQTSGAVAVKYFNSENSKIEIPSASADSEPIEYSIKDNSLFISNKKNQPSVLVKVYGNSLKSIIASGASTFKCLDTLFVNEFKINGSGAASVFMKVKSEKLSVTGSGASNIKLGGETNELSTTLTGAASLKAYELKAENIVIETSGASHAKVFTNKKISILSTGSSQVKFKGNPTDVSAEGNETSRVVKINEGSDGESGDTTKTTTFQFRGKKIIIIDNGNDDCDTAICKNISEYTRNHWQGFWLGFAGYTSPSRTFQMDKPYDYMNLDYGRSFSMQWNLGQTNINIIKPYLQLNTGIGLQFNNFKFENKTRLNADSSFTSGIIDSTDAYTYRKNKFKQTYATVPLLLTINTSKNLRKNFHISFGVVGKYLLNSKTKQVLIYKSDEFRIRRKDSYNLNSFQVDAYASIGYRDVTLYAQYGITELFKTKQAPEVYAFSAGIRLIPFD